MRRLGFSRIFSPFKPTFVILSLRTWVFTGWFGLWPKFFHVWLEMLVVTEIVCMARPSRPPLSFSELVAHPSDSVSSDANLVAVGEMGVGFLFR